MEATVRSQIFRKRIVVRLVIDNKKLMDLFEFAEHFRNLRHKEPGLVLDGAQVCLHDIAYVFVDCCYAIL